MQYKVQDNLVLYTKDGIKYLIKETCKTKKQAELLLKELNGES
jgi:hypothetical protein